MKEAFINKNNIFSYLFVPYIFAIYPIVRIFSLNAKLIGFAPFLSAMTIIILFSCIVFYSFAFFYKDYKKGSIFTSCLIFLFYQYGWFEKFLSVYAFWGLVIALFLLMLKNFDTEKLFRIFIFISVILCMYNTFDILTVMIKSLRPDINKSSNIITPDLLTTKAKQKYDIYIILLDSYPANEVLKRDFNFDNKNFINYLKSKNFFVHESMYSNYTKTVASVPSFTNLDYIKNLNYYNTFSDAVENSLLFKTAKKNGYKTFYINTFSLFDFRNGYIDNFTDLTSYYSMFNMTKIFFFNTLFKHIFYIFDSGAQKDDVFWNILDTKIYEESPKLIFAHILAPHFPYLKDRNNNPIKKEDQNDYLVNAGGLEYKINKKSCLEYLIHVNSMTVKAVDNILKASEGNAYILILGDHGLRQHYFLYDEKKYFDILLKEKNTMNSFFNTFVAFYNPEKDYEQIKKQKSLINIFITFTNNLFGTRYQTKKDKFYYVYSSFNGQNINDILNNVKIMKSEEFK